MYRILFELVFLICIVILYPTLNKHFLKIIIFRTTPIPGFGHTATNQMKAVNLKRSRDPTETNFRP